MRLDLCTIRQYRKATHQADVTISTSQSDITAHLSHIIQWWQVTVGAYALLAMPNETDPTTACVIAIYSPTQQPPLDPHFDPSMGHKHSGVEDDAPTI